MTEMALPARLPNDFLNRRMLRRAEGIDEGLTHALDLLMIDSVYVVKDDFDAGINERLWTVANMELADHNPFGVLYGTSPEDEPTRAGGSALLRSRIANFYPSRRAALLLRASISDKSEIGFVQEDSGDVPAVSRTGSTDYRNCRSAVLARRASAAWRVYAVGTNGVTSTSVTIAVTEAPWDSYLVAVNEQGEVRLWINGQHVNNERASRTDVHVTNGHYLWVRSDGALSVDYIQAWQERTSL